MNSIYNIYEHHFTNQINFISKQQCTIFDQIQSLYPNVIMIEQGVPAKNIVNEIASRICDLAANWLKFSDSAIINMHLTNLHRLKTSSESSGCQTYEQSKIKNVHINHQSNSTSSLISCKPKILNNFNQKCLKNATSFYQIKNDITSLNLTNNNCNITVENGAAIKSITNGEKGTEFFNINEAVDLTVEDKDNRKNNNDLEIDSFDPIKIDVSNISSLDIIRQSNYNNLRDHQLNNTCNIFLGENFEQTTSYNRYSFTDNNKTNECIQSSENLLIKCKLDTCIGSDIIESKEVNVIIGDDNKIDIDLNSLSSTIKNPDNSQQLAFLKLLNLNALNDTDMNFADSYQDQALLQLNENRSLNSFNDTLDSLINQELAHKDILLYKKKLYNCFRCRYSTDVLVNYQRHLRAHAGRFICRLCNRAFVKSDDLYRHWSTHNVKASNGYYMCDSCEFTAPSKVSVEEHMRTHYRLKMAKEQSKQVCCGICKCLIDRSKQYEHKRLVHGRFFQKDSALGNLKSKHISKCLSGKLYKCPECCRHIRNARALLRHHFIAHVQPKSPVKGELVSGMDKTQMTCRFCKLEFFEVDDLDKHEISHVISEFVVTDVTSSLKQEKIDFDGVPKMYSLDRQ